MDTVSINTVELEYEFRDEWETDIKRLESLSKKVQNLHAKVLYCQTNLVMNLAHSIRNCIILNVGASCGHWRELGMFLELQHNILDYIENSVSDDKTDTILKVYMQYDHATIDKITAALFKMKRYDILKDIEHPLLQIAHHFFKTNSMNSDTGYHSRGSCSEYTIITPKNVPIYLPEVLKIKHNEDIKCMEEVEEQFQNLKAKANLCKESKSFSKLLSDKSIIALDRSKQLLFLTYAEDGRNLADSIKCWINEWPAEFSGIQVVTLNSRKAEVLQNPEAAISELIQQADYVVPIITKGYLKRITCKDRITADVSADLDAQYARFVYTQLMHRYTLEDACMNKSVRAVLPTCADADITLNLPLHHPVLLPWTCEADFDEYFQHFLRNKNSLMED